MNIVDASDSSDISSQSEQSDRSSPSSQSASSDSSSESSRADSGESSEASSRSRRKASRGEMEPLVEKYIRQGMSAPDIVERISTVDRLLTYTGKQLDEQAVYNIKTRMKKRQASEPSEQTKKEKRADRKSQPDRSVRSDRSKQAVPSQQPEPPVRLEDSFRDFRDLPPRKREGRKETRDYAKLNSTVDIELWKRFEEERIRRRWTATDMMELILFNAFRHPTLSYAEPEVAKPEPEASKTRRKRR